MTRDWRSWLSLFALAAAARIDVHDTGIAVQTSQPQRLYTWSTTLLKLNRLVVDENVQISTSSTHSCFIGRDTSERSITISSFPDFNSEETTIMVDASPDNSSKPDARFSQRRGTCLNSGVIISNEHSTGVEIVYYPFDGSSKSTIAAASNQGDYIAAGDFVAIYYHRDLNVCSEQSGIKLHFLTSSSPAKIICSTVETSQRMILEAADEEQVVLRQPSVNNRTSILYVVPISSSVIDPSHVAIASTNDYSNIRIRRGLMSLVHASKISTVYIAIGQLDQRVWLPLMSDANTKATYIPTGDDDLIRVQLDDLIATLGPLQAGITLVAKMLAPQLMTQVQPTAHLNGLILPVIQVHLATCFSLTRDYYVDGAFGDATIVRRPLIEPNDTNDDGGLSHRSMTGIISGSVLAVLVLVGMLALICHYSGTAPYVVLAEPPAPPAMELGVIGRQGDHHSTPSTSPTGSSTTLNYADVADLAVPDVDFILHEPPSPPPYHYIRVDGPYHELDSRFDRPYYEVDIQVDRTDSHARFDPPFRNVTAVSHPQYDRLREPTHLTRIPSLLELAGVHDATDNIAMDETRAEAAEADLLDSASASVTQSSSVA